MSQIQIDLPHGNTISIEDVDSNDRLDGRDTILINGETFDQNQQVCGPREEIWQYFLGTLGVSSLQQAGSLQGAARIFQARHDAFSRVREGDCGAAESLIRESNLIASQNGMPSTLDIGINLFNDYTSGLSIFSNSSINLQTEELSNLLSLGRSETCALNPDEPLYWMSNNLTLGCSTCLSPGQGENAFTYEINEGEAQNSEEIVRNQNANRRLDLNAARGENMPTYNANDGQARSPEETARTQNTNRRIELRLF